jgi:hypothetical protein
LPAAATTTTPPNQSFSTALFSGSYMKLFGTAEWSEKFATRMLKRALFSWIHSAAAMTSLVRAMPLSSMTSSDTIGAFGSAPA